MDKLCQANVNFFWGGLTAEVLARLGLKYAVISPGSRSAPLTTGFATCRELEAIPVLDERSASFFALGLARRTGKPVALVCTSGTAVANYLPAVVEAEASGIPLILLTADRPPEMRDCSSGQTIDQRKIFGRYTVWEHELALPDTARFGYLRQTLVHAYRRCLTPMPGPVHLNVPFRDPLAPVKAEKPFLPKNFSLKAFLATVRPPQIGGTLAQLDTLDTHEKGLIIAGYAQVSDPTAYAETILGMARQLGWPVLADVLSPLRSHAPDDAPLVCHYHALLRDRQWADKHRPDFVLQFGDLPTSKVLRTWLAGTEAETLVIDGSYRNLDPTHAKATHLRLGSDAYAEPMTVLPAPPGKFAESWLKAEAKTGKRIQQSLQKLEPFFEGKLPFVLSRKLPKGTPVFIASSMPVRDAELFWQPGERAYRIHANRGANGIDGTLSTALGVAHDGKPAVLLTGDLAFLHDSNGLLIASKLRGSLTVLLINNRGGRIFENLPISGYEPPFEAYFATPQQVDFRQLCQAHDIAYHRPENWRELDKLIGKLPRKGVRVIEIVTDPSHDVPYRKQLLDGVTPESSQRPTPRKKRPHRKKTEKKNAESDSASHPGTNHQRTPPSSTTNN